MERQVIQERICRLREKMKEKGIDYYLIPTADFHQSEYVSDYFKVREFFSGFSGSNGTLLVGMEESGLWTDGRYFLQAERELEGSGIVLYRMQEEGVPTIPEYLKAHVREGAVLGFDGRVITASYGKQLEETLSSCNAQICFTHDLAGEIWQERPEMPAGCVWPLDISIAGVPVPEKLAGLRKRMRELQADYLVISKLDDIMWLFNIRGNDIPGNPVALAYGIIGDAQAWLFLQEDAVTEELEQFALQNRITIELYARFVEVLDGELLKELSGELTEGQREGSASKLTGVQIAGNILYDSRSSSYTIRKRLQGNQKLTLIDAKNPTEYMKAVKNPVEMENLRRVFEADSAAVTKFIYWLKQTIRQRQTAGTEALSEMTAAAYLDALRREIPGCLDLSFETIAAYQENAAIIHYQANEETNRPLEQKGLLLVDSGGQYIGGTTDVTRTIVLGELSETIKQHYTAVAAGMLHLSKAVFLKGCTGRNLDILARQPLWKQHLDYKHGTGHGIGYMLNVHEGPHTIGWRYLPESRETVLESGMLVSNEPGIYCAGSYGIRIENCMLCVGAKQNEYGSFLRFETLTYVPLDQEAIAAELLSDEERKLLNEYHGEVYRRMLPYMTEEEAVWLKKCTEEI